MGATMILLGIAALISLAVASENESDGQCYIFWGDCNFTTTQLILIIVTVVLVSVLFLGCYWYRARWFRRYQEGASTGPAVIAGGPRQPYQGQAAGHGQPAGYGQPSGYGQPGP